MIKIVIIVLILGLFFLQKVGTHAMLLNPPYNKVYRFFNTIFNYIFSFLRKYIKPITIGRGLDLDIIDGKYKSEVINVKPSIFKPNKEKERQ